jgi:hypothetical protein
MADKRKLLFLLLKKRYILLKLLERRKRKGVRELNKRQKEQGAFNNLV